MKAEVVRYAAVDRDGNRFDGNQVMFTIDVLVQSGSEVWTKLIAAIKTDERVIEVEL